MPLGSSSASCPDCRTSTIVVDSSEGNQLCIACGRILESSLISDQQEWRNFNTESNVGSQNEKSRVGEVTDGWLDLGTNSTTFIGGSRKMQQLQNLMGNFEYADKQLKNAFVLLRTVGDALAIREQALERAKDILKDLNQQSQLKGRTNYVNILAVIYLGCREAGMCRTLKELIIYDRNISERDLGRAINKLKKCLPHRGNTQVEDATQLIPRFCSKLKIPTSLATVCEYAASKAVLLLRTAHRSNSLAAGVIYLVTQLSGAEGPSIFDIAQVSGASDNTIKVIWRELVGVAARVLPSNFGK